MEIYRINAPNIRVDVPHLTGWVFPSGNVSRVARRRDSGFWHRSLDPFASVNVTVGENKYPWKKISWGLSFPTWKHSGNCWHGPNHQTWDLGRDTERWQKELAPSVVTRNWKSCVSQSKDIVLENWFGVKVTIHSKMKIHSLTSHLYTQIVHRTFLGLHSKTKLQHSPKQLT